MERKKAIKNRQKTRKKRLITAEDLLKFQLVSDPQISPDGRWILFTKKHIGEKNDSITNLWVVGFEGEDLRQFTSGGKDGAGRWSPDGKKIAFVSGREQPKNQIHIMPANGGEAISLTKFPEGKIGNFKWSPDGKKLAVTFREQEPEWTTEAKKERENKGLSIPPRVIDTIWYRLDGDGYFNNQRHALYIVDAESGKYEKVFDKDFFGFFDFDWSPDSKRIAISANTDKKAFLHPWNDRIYLFDVETKKLREIPNQKDGNKGSVKFSPDGKFVAFVGREGRKEVWEARNVHLFVMDVASGKTRNLTSHTDYCMQAITLSDAREAAFDANFAWSPDGKTIYAQIGWHGETHVAGIPASGGEIYFITDGEAEHILGNISKNGERFALLRCNFLELPEVYAGTLTSKELSLKKITHFNKELFEELELSKPKSHWVASTDNTNVQVWVMRPPRAKPNEKTPAVLEIHGGPHAQYGTAFFHEFQLLAAEGYTVFFSNPRGSKGYGEKHCNAIKGKWGEKDWEDIQAVIQFMTKQPYVDTKKMGVMGGSYGGYMTNWVIGHTNQFAAAITDRCVSNLLSMAGSSDFPDVPDTYFEGAPWDRPESLWKQSPIAYFKNVKTPTLVIHSEGDLRCNIEQAEQVFSALQVLGVPSRFVRYPSTTSHGLSRSGPPDLRIHRLKQILEWWGKYLKGRQHEKRKR